MRNKYIIATLLALLASEVPAQRLLVSVTVDELNSDKMIAVGQKSTSQGFKKLLERALIYQNASYPFAPVDRASAIAAIMTGASPYYNGITGAKWLDTSTLRPATCVAGDTPGNLLSSTFTDELKVGTEGQSLVFSIANHKDAAILSAGHAADAAFWRDEHTRRWKTSSYYSKTGFKWLSAFDALNADEGNFNLAKLALQCIDSHLLGSDANCDILAIHFDNDNYENLDRCLGSLINGVEQKVGAQNVVFSI